MLRGHPRRGHRGHGGRRGARPGARRKRRIDGRGQGTPRGPPVRRRRTGGTGPTARPSSCSTTRSPDRRTTVVRQENVRNLLDECPYVAASSWSTASAISPGSSGPAATSSGAGRQTRAQPQTEFTASPSGAVHETGARVSEPAPPRGSRRRRRRPATRRGRLFALRPPALGMGLATKNSPRATFPRVAMLATRRAVAAIPRNRNPVRFASCAQPRFGRVFLRVDDRGRHRTGVQLDRRHTSPPVVRASGTGLPAHVHDDGDGDGTRPTMAGPQQGRPGAQALLKYDLTERGSNRVETGGAAP